MFCTIAIDTYYGAATTTNVCQRGPNSVLGSLLVSASV